MWKVYPRTKRRFKIVVDYIWMSEVEYKWCNEDELNNTIQKLYDKYKDNKNAEIHVYEILDLDWKD